jgi:hypothetical protein
MVPVLAVEVADPYVVAIMGPSFVLVVGFMAWIVRELARISKATTVLEAKLEKSEALVELRLRELEHWRLVEEDRREARASGG